MRKTKMMFISLLAVFALGAVASASASAAPLWLINKSGTFGTEAISNSAISFANGKLEDGSIEIACPTLKIEDGSIKEGSTGKAASVTFSECKEVDEEEACELSSSTTTTNPVTIDIIGPTKIEIAPEGTTEFITIKINNKTGRTCNLKGKYIIAGDAKAAVANAGTEQVSHLLTFTGPPITGSGSMRLASGKDWSIMS